MTKATVTEPQAPYLKKTEFFGYIYLETLKNWIINAFSMNIAVLIFLSFRG